MERAFLLSLSVVVLFCIVAPVLFVGCNITRSPDGGYEMRPADGAIEALSQALGSAMQAYLSADDPVERADLLERISRLRVEIEAWRVLRDNWKVESDVETD